MTWRDGVDGRTTEEMMERHIRPSMESIVTTTAIRVKDMLTLWHERKYGRWIFDSSLSETISVNTTHRE